MAPEDLRPGTRLRGLSEGVVVLVHTEPLGAGALNLVYRCADGTLGEQVLTEDDLARLESASATTWSFDADADDLTLALEATRMRLAGLVDPMLAVTTSRVDPLPHQLRAVYGEMLPRPGALRYLLADDPGAGKTIMAGLYIKELLLRGDVERCLVVAPGGLVDQWQDELREKFDLHFTVLSRDLAEASPDGNPFDRHPHLIARMDQLSRDESWLTHLTASEWDLVVVDEAHRMSASYSGQELRRTRRYELGQQLGRISRHLLLMTATPHAGKDEDFQAFLALLDPDRFEGAYRRGIHRADYSGLMRRMVKEELLTFDGRALFPERIAQTVSYTLTTAERALYEQVTDYVRHQMNLADAVASDGDTRRRTTVGFALTVLQRRLASSPEAIYQSLVRRRDRLHERRDALSAAPFDPDPSRTTPGDPLSARLRLAEEDAEELAAEELESLEDEVLDAATAARTVDELDIELAVLAHLVATASQVRASGEDRKWTELRELLRHAQTAGPGGGPAKLIVFTEHRDTLTYLTRRISTLLGDPDAVVSISGSTRRVDRLAIRERFSKDPRCWVLVATDAAGEGLNLQVAHLMVNYDLPWNPNRLEQRFGRIHRIGQREVCHLWNLVAADTREGQVFERLLAKIEEQRKAYGGKVFDVLGENAFGERGLRDLLIEAIRYGDDPARRATLEKVIDAGVGRGVGEMVRERALATGSLSPEELFRLRREMDEARARRLQPHYVGLFFRRALRAAGGSFHPREQGRCEITHVPQALRSARVVGRYERICFDPDAIDVAGRPRADLVAPGHPLFDAVVRATLDRAGHALSRGSVLLDPTPGARARLLVGLAQEIHDGEGSVLSRRFDFVNLTAGGAEEAGFAPHLDLVPPASVPHDGVALARAVAELRAAPWLADGVEARATEWAVANGLPAHRAEVEHRVGVLVERTRSLVTLRLNAQANHWYAESVRLAEDQAAGRRVRIAPATARQRAEDLEQRLTRRLERLAAQERLEVRPPRVVTAAVVIPREAVVPGAAEIPDAVAHHAVDTVETDRRAIAAVMAAERALGRVPEEQHHSNKGFDIRSGRPDGSTLFLEVKGRLRGAEDFHVSVSQVLTGHNVADDFVLAMVEVDPGGDASRDRVRYVLRPFASLVVDERLQAGVPLRWKPMWERGVAPR